MKKDCVLYVQGKGGSANESAHYMPLFPDADVLGLEYRSDIPWEAGEEIRTAVKDLKKTYETLTLIANSVGAYFCLCAGIDAHVRKAYFISPVVDMERLIRERMAGANVTEERLRAEGVIPTPFGEPLSWAYLSYVLAHPIRWNAPSCVLYGENDALISREAVEAFAKTHAAVLTVMPGGEHWFHTQEQMRFLDAWIRTSETKENGGSL